MPTLKGSLSLVSPDGSTQLKFELYYSPKGRERIITKWRKLYGKGFDKCDLQDVPVPKKERKIREKIEN